MDESQNNELDSYATYHWVHWASWNKQWPVKNVSVHFIWTIWREIFTFYTKLPGRLSSNKRQKYSERHPFDNLGCIGIFPVTLFFFFSMSQLAHERNASNSHFNMHEAVERTPLTVIVKCCWYTLYKWFCRAADICLLLEKFPLKNIGSTLIQLVGPVPFANANLVQKHWLA